MKYFIPPKLNRGFNIGPYSIMDAILLVLTGLTLVYLSLKFRTKIFFMPYAIMLVTRFKIQNRTIGSQALKRGRYIKNRTEYELRTCFNEEN
ncbi:MAG: hypothetical protein RSC41_05860 [Oscillospiraceae bacterium]